MKFEYKAITHYRIDEFNIVLSKQINEGWEPFGSLTIGECGGYSVFALLLKRELKPNKES